MTKIIKHLKQINSLSACLWCIQLQFLRINLSCFIHSANSYFWRYVLISSLPNYSGIITLSDRGIVTVLNFKMESFSLSAMCSEYIYLLANHERPKWQPWWIVQAGLGNCGGEPLLTVVMKACTPSSCYDFAFFYVNYMHENNTAKSKEESSIKENKEE